jgi:hypothetical protein
MELDRRLRRDLGKTGNFSRVHPMPRTSAEVPDDLDARLVVLGIDDVYTKEPGNVAELAAKSILETRGNTPRIYRNTLVFLAADKVRLQDLDEATRKYVAWESILDEKESLDLSPFQVRSAETQKAAADSAVTARLPETYQWLLLPTQSSAQGQIEWQALRLSGSENLAVRASKKIVNEELLIPSLGANRLRMELDRVPLWRENHVAIRQLVDDFARYVYLPRLADSAVLMNAVRDGLTLLTWSEDSFGYAESFDETADRYRGLRGGQNVSISENDTGLLVKPEVAKRQIAEETRTRGDSTERATEQTEEQQKEAAKAEKTAAAPRRFHGTVDLDPERVGRDASQIADEVVSHLNSLVGAEVRVTLEIEAKVPKGVPENVVRTVTENSRTLKFESHGFEKE